MIALKNVDIRKNTLKILVFSANTLILVYFLLNEMFGYLEMPAGEFLTGYLKFLILDPVLWGYVAFMAFLKNRKLIVINSDPIIELVVMFGLNMFLLYILYLRPDFTAYIIFILLLFNSNMFYNEIINRIFAVK